MNINDSIPSLGSGVSNFVFNPAYRKFAIGWYSGTEVHLDTNASGIAKICDIPFRYNGGSTQLSFENSFFASQECSYGNSNYLYLIDTPTVNFYINGYVSNTPVPVLQGNITGDTMPCVGATSVYSIVSSAGISYAWTGPGTWAGSSDSCNINFVVGAFNQDSIIVAPVNACGDTGAHAAMYVNHSVPPVIFGSISGNYIPCIGSYSQYSVAGSGGITYSWTAPVTWTGSGTSDSITYYIGNFTSDTLFVSPINICNDTGASVSVVVTANSPPLLTGPVSGPPHPASGTYAQYSVAGTTGLTYTWTAPGNWTGSGTSNSITFLVGAYLSDSVSVSAANDCGSGNTLSVQVSDNTSINKQGTGVFGLHLTCDGFGSWPILELNLPEEGMVSINIFNPMGEKITNERDFTFLRGRNKVDLHIQGIGAGVYFCVVNYSSHGDDIVKSMKINVIK